jgi:hypothetical protein
MSGPNATRRLPLGVLVLAAGLVVLVVVAAAFSRGGATAGPSPGPSAVVDPTASASPTPTVSPSPTPTQAPTPTASPTPEPVAVLVGAGDIARCDSEADSRTADLVDAIEGTVFTAGDNVYDDGTPEEFATCYDESWGRHKDRTRPAPGNHDWATRALAGYFGYFGDAARGPDGRSWYSYDAGAWHVIVLDSECDRVGGCDEDSDQGRWLAADLAASDATCTIAIWHVPRFSSGDEHGNDPSVGPLWDALYAAGADVIVNGHDHDYERFAPQDPSGTEDRARGIRQFVAGTGGTSLRGFDEPVANSEVRAAVAQGVLKLTLRPSDYDWEFIEVGGEVGDRGTGTCH